MAAQPANARSLLGQGLRCGTGEPLPGKSMGGRMAGKLTCVYATDLGFLPVTCFSIRTLADNASIPLDITVITAGLSQAETEEARGYLAGHGVDARFTAMADGEFDGLPRPQSLPKATYGRLVMHKFLPRDLDRVLYIDGDTLVDIDVAPLAAERLQGHTLGAVLDIGRVLIGRREEAQQRLDLGADGDYFNAGMLLIDWQLWQERAVGARSLDALMSTPERFTQKDQCALNYICRRDWRPLDWRWNYQPAAMVHGGLDRALFHFLGGRKPWRTDHLRHPMRFVQRYHSFFAGSPWSAEFQPPKVPYQFAAVLRAGKQLASPRHWRTQMRYRKLLASV